jgi:uncharacterized membrane protein
MIRNTANQRMTLAKDTAMTVAGLTMVATPLALWMSPNTTVFYATLMTCGVAYLVTVLLARLD